MSIDMDLSASRAQASSFKRMAAQKKQGYDEMERAINQFALNSPMLTGAAYDAAKRHYTNVLIPLVKGGRLLTEAAERAVQKFPEEYVSQVDSVSLKESKLTEQINRLQKQIEAKKAQQSQLRQLASQLPSEERGSARKAQQGLSNSIAALEKAKKKLEKKREKLRAFHRSSPAIFSEIAALEAAINKGATVSAHAWNGSTFVTPLANDMEWANMINEKWENREHDISITSEWINAGGGYQYQSYKVFIDGIFDQEKSDELNKLMAEAFKQGIVDGSFKGFHTTGEFLLINDLYRLIYGKDWLSGDESSRSEALAWLALTALPIGKITQISKELKAGNKLLKGVSLTDKELKILNNSKILNTYIAKQVTLDSGEVAYKALNGEYVRSPKYLNSNGTINWPKADGFVVDKFGNPITRNANLNKGQIIDRYGNSNGTFSSPFENGKKIDYDKRGIPYPESSKPYHQYEVVQDINIKNVQNAYNKMSVSEKDLLRSEMEFYGFTLNDIANPKSGEIAKVFGQGGGTQIKLGTSVEWYEKLGLIKEIK